MVYSQSEIEVQCGQIIENEFTDNLQEHIYLLNMAPRESFDVSVEPFGDFLNTVIAVYGPTGLRISTSERQDAVGVVYLKPLPSTSSGTLSARGQYKIRIANAPLKYDEIYTDLRYAGGVGLYQLLVSCTTSDGKKIKSGDTSQPTPTPIPAATIQSVQTNQISPTSDSNSESTFSFLTTAQSYEVTFGSQTKIVKLIELTDAGWAKIEVNGGTGWLNLYQVALIIPLD